MHIKDHSAAMKFFRTYDNVASKGKWKEFVDEMEFESMIQEPRTMAQEPRIGLQGGQLVQPGVEGVRQGYDGAEATALKFFDKDVAEFGEDVLNEAAQLLEGKNYSELEGDKYWNTKKKIRNELKEFGSVLKESEARKRAAKVKAKREAKIKINLIEATQEGFFEPEEFIKKNNITLKQLEKEAKQLKRQIYEKRGILTGKKSESTLEWLTPDDFKLDNTLSKLSQSELIVFKRNKLKHILYDAFGRRLEKGSTTKLNPTRDVEKYNAMKKNLNEFDNLKKAIAAKYPSLKFQWDHPLSKQTIEAMMTGTAEELSRVNILDAELNNGFKKSLSDQYLKSLTAKNGKVDLEAKRAVEKIAKDLKLNIGNISDDVQRFERGAPSLEKLNIKEEVIKSLKNQKDLSTNFKSYLKNNPELFEIAGFKDTSKLGTKLTKVTDKHIKGTIKLLQKLGYGRHCKASGGRVGFQDAGDVGAGQMKCIMDDVKKTKADMKSSSVEVRAMAKTKLTNGFKIASKMPQLAKILKTGVQLGTAAITKPLQALGLTSGIGYAIEGLVEGYFYDAARRKGYSHEQAMAETLTPGLIAGRPHDVPWYGGSEKLREKELIGDAQQNPKVAHYVDALKEQDRIYEATGAKEQAKADLELAETGFDATLLPGDLDAASADVQDLARSGAYNRVNQTMNPESMASQAYNTAVENREALDQRRRTEYLEKVEPAFLEREQKSFDTKRHREKRYEEMDKMYPVTDFSDELIDKLLKQSNMYINPKFRSEGRTVENPQGLEFLQGFTYDDVRKFYKAEEKRELDKQKQSYFAQNFKMEKAEGGIMSLKKKR